MTEKSINTVELFLDDIRKVSSPQFQKVKQDYIYNCYAKVLRQKNEKEGQGELEIEREINEITKEANKQIAEISFLVFIIASIFGLMALGVVIYP